MESKPKQADNKFMKNSKQLAMNQFLLGKPILFLKRLDYDLLQEN
jgi:hypothetical protein